MARPKRPVFPLFRSELYAEVAFHVFHADVPLSVKDLMELVGSSRRTVGGIVDELVEAGIFQEGRIGRTRQLTARTDAPFYEPLLHLLTVVEGPQAVVRDALAELEFICEAFIFGSWAARSQGERGHFPRDIDVLVISAEKLSVSARVEVRERLESAEQVLRREVNPTFATVEQWRHSEDPFLHSIRSSTIVEVAPSKRGKIPA